MSDEMFKSLLGDSKEARLKQMQIMKSVYPNRETVITSDERDRILSLLTEHNLKESDVFHSGMGSGCGAYETYDLDGVRYDLVFPEVNGNHFQMIRFDPIDWDAKIKTVEQED